MAVTNDLGAPAEYPQQPAFDRQPPQDIAAEQAVLGGMLLSKDAIADVVEELRGTDFYRPAHQMIYDTVLDLYGRGEPADPVTVSAELTRAGQLMRIGGAPYLHTLMSSVPTAANAGYYARIVAEQAVLRRLIEAGTRIVQLGYGAASGNGGDLDDVVDRAQAAVYEVTEQRTSEDYVRLEQLLTETMDEIDLISSHGGISTGVPTGFADLDGLTNGLHPGQMIIIAARPALGKALALDTPLPTPTGWTTMGAVQVGAELLGADGRPTRVIAATDVMHGRPCYEVEFSDGEVIVADAEHLWQTTTRASRRQRAETRPPTHYWTGQSLDRLRVATARELAEPDRLVGTTELLAEVGQQFSVILRSKVIRAVPCAGSRTLATRAVPVYSRHALLTGLLGRATRPKAAGQRHNHDGPVTTRDIASTLRCPDGRSNHLVEQAAPLQLPARELSLAPYLLGVWLGDGATAAARLTSADPEIADHLRAEGYVVRDLGGLNYSLQLPKPPPIAARACAVCGASFVPKMPEVRTCGRSCGGRARHTPPVPLPPCPDCGGAMRAALRGRCAACWARTGTVQGRLRTLGVLGNKHIPLDYLRASEPQRRALLAGLLDTDGTVTRTGNVQFTSTDPRLAADVRELVVSLGYRCGFAVKRVAGRPGRETGYTITFTTADDLFRLARKRQVHVERRGPRYATRTAGRYIVAVRPVPSVPVRCVQVASGDHLFLAGRLMVPTHNSTLALDLARAASIKNGESSVIFSLEMSRTEITMRLLSAEAKVPLHHMRSGRMSDEDWARLARRMGEVAEAPLYIDDSPNLTLMEIRAKARRLKQRHNLRLVVVDYLQLMNSGRRVESRQQEVSEFSRALKLLAKELEVPVVALSQLNRGPEQRTDKKPMLSDLRESGCLTAETRVLRADTGAEVSLGELLASGARDIPVWSLDDRLRLVPRTMTHVFPSGTKEVFELRLASGRCVTATANHPFLSYAGWQRLDQVRPGDRLGVPRQVPPPLGVAPAGAGRLRAVRGDTDLDTVPPAVWQRVGAVLAGWRRTDRELATARVVALLAEADLDLLGTNDVRWDTVAAVRSLGERAVYDATVLGTHNFIANGIAVHNSLEQDADMVILLHREDAYERESPRAGEADLILAKNRNGPTGTVTVAFQGHYSRFVDMQQGG